MNEQGPTHDGNFIRGALQRKRANGPRERKRAKDGERSKSVTEEGKREKRRDEERGGEGARCVQVKHMHASVWPSGFTLCYYSIAIE